MACESISIHAPRVGRDDDDGIMSYVREQFQSTRPVWGATKQKCKQSFPQGFQSTRPVWGATAEEEPVLSDPLFQSTRPVWGATRILELYGCTETPFQSTRPVWGATQLRCSNGRCQRHFNPRAPCGARRCSISRCRRRRNFNPRAPCGARPPRYFMREDGSVFQSTRPVWGATIGISVLGCFNFEISIHAPRVGRDPYGKVTFKLYIPFQSTRPVWGATIQNLGTSF